MFVLLGVRLGAGVAIGEIPVLVGVVDAFGQVASAVTHTAVGWLTGVLPLPGDVGTVTSAALAVATPGLVCVALAAAVRAGKAAIGVAEAALVVVAFAAFFYLDTLLQAIAVLAICVVAGGLLIRSAGGVALVPLAATGAAMIAGVGRLVWQQQWMQLPGADVIADYLGGEPVLVIPGVLVLLLGPVVVAASWLWSDANSSAGEGSSSTTPP